MKHVHGELLIRHPHVDSHIARPIGRQPKWGPQVKVLDFHYRAKIWTKPRRVVCKLVSYHAKKWHVHVASAFPLAHYYRAVFGYV